MSHRYEGRIQAGQVLAGHLDKLGLGASVVVGISHGGIAVAEPIARQLGAPLVALETRELRAPEAPDSPFGAIDEDGQAVLDYRALVTLGLSASDIETMKSHAAGEMARFRTTLPGPRLSECAPGRTVVLVDDGLVGSLVMQVSVACARRHAAAAVVVAVPRASDLTSYELGSLLCGKDDRLVCPPVDPSVSEACDLYLDSHEVTDTDVARILAEAASANPLAS